MQTSDDKAKVRDFWEAASCGEALYLSSPDRHGFSEQSRIRYELEPYIEKFAGFRDSKGKAVLEIGVGLGADHQRYAESGAELFGVDLTQRAVENVRLRFRTFGLTSRVTVGDAENLPFPNEAFDLVYSWGVIHHSPDTPKAAREIERVLKPGGAFRVMIYHKYSIVGLMLWLRYALLAMRPWTSLEKIYAGYLESPGTKAFTCAQARQLFSHSTVHVSTVLTHSDLLTSEAGQRHGGALLTLARRIWPRTLIKRLVPWAGLFLLIEGTTD